MVMKIHEQLATWLKAKGLSQTDFCEIAGISNSHISMILKGKRLAGRRVAHKIDSATGGAISAAELLCAQVGRDDLRKMQNAPAQVEAP